MHQGEGSLSKLQFKEVSSFYSNNGIFFIMYAKPQSFKYNNSNSVNSSDKNINYHLIRPLVIKDIIVKAKKKWFDDVRIIDNKFVCKAQWNKTTILINNSSNYLFKIMNIRYWSLSYSYCTILKYLLDKLNGFH